MKYAIFALAIAALACVTAAQAEESSVACVLPDASTHTLTAADCRELGGVMDAAAAPRSLADDVSPRSLAAPPAGFHWECGRNGCVLLKDGIHIAQSAAAPALPAPPAEQVVREKPRVSLSLWYVGRHMIVGYSSGHEPFGSPVLVPSYGPYGGTKVCAPNGLWCRYY